MKSFYLYFLFVVSALFSSTSFALEVKVDAGPFPLNHTPVFLEMNSAPSENVVVTHGSQVQVGQIERLENGRVKVWWMVDSLQKESSKVYSISFEYAPPAQKFSWSSEEKIGMDLSYGDRTLLRYMHPSYDPNDVESTKKPFHHVFDPTGAHLITKGVGGKYSHHRGIFFGYNKVYIGGDVVDIWHARNGEHSVHREVVRESVGAVFGEQVLLIDWKDAKGKPFIQETRTLRVYQPADDQFLVEFWTELQSLRGHIRLEGDRQHAGVQFRAAQEVAEHENTTRFLRPDIWKHLEPEKANNAENFVDLPWNAMQFTVEDTRYTAAYLTDPANPDGARFSERAYGRFGEFVPYEITEDQPLRLHYQWWIKTGDDVSRETIEAQYQTMVDPPRVKVIVNDR
ncbi:MAG: PmoA family protein [Candidatus Hinthialibacter antarcticus]|nr:PmoA family protein [Candidatus Hinthialibacter antarcticus]